ncbi:MAG: hypothetical protein HC875_37135 [Anaerolineales bacterium]|nr:hypothetical protein [Anaerolineales bacterium]
MVALAVDLGAHRLEVAHVQYYGWALLNRAALMPTREQLEAATAIVERSRRELRGRLAIDYVIPDYWAKRPKPCMGGWGRRSLNVTPSGKVLPCHAAEVIPGLTFWSVTEHSLAESRLILIGTSDTQRVLTVVFTYRSSKNHEKEIYRIISGRPASKIERKAYVEAAPAKR